MRKRPALHGAKGRPDESGRGTQECVRHGGGHRRVAGPWRTHSWRAVSPLLARALRVSGQECRTKGELPGGFQVLCGVECARPRHTIRMELAMLRCGPDRGGSGTTLIGGCGRRHSARGFVLITMLCCTMLLVAFLGLAIDAGYLQFQKPRMQTAADAAALGGVQGDQAANGAAGVVAAAHGRMRRSTASPNGVGGVTVTVNSPPSSGYSSSDATGVEVIIVQQVPTFFYERSGGFVGWDAGARGGAAGPTAQPACTCSIQRPATRIYREWRGQCADRVAGSTWIRAAPARFMLRAERRSRPVRFLRMGGSR